MIRSDGARRVVLALVGLSFLVLAFSSLRSHAPSIDATNEWRAIYFGLWLAQAAYFAIAVKRVDWPILGDLGAMLLLGQPFGRLVSVVVDGFPSRSMWLWFVLELTGGLAILLVRPRRRIS